MASIEYLDELDGMPHANVFPGAEPKTIRLTLATGERVAPHRHPDREIVLYLVEGALDVQLGAETYSVEAGDVVRFDGDQNISPRATRYATALIILAPRVE